MVDDISLDEIEVGDIYRGRMLVYRGDDRPDEWVDWLDDMISELEHLEQVADSRGIALNVGGWDELCEGIGIDGDSSFWEGEMISGMYQMGWIDVDSVKSAQKLGRRLLKDAEKDLMAEIKAASIKSLRSITDLEDLIERTQDRTKDLEELEALKVTKQQLDAQLSEARFSIRNLQDGDQSEYYAMCLEFLISLARSSGNTIVAGPLVCWKGRIFAVTKIGTHALPHDSAFARTIELLGKSGFKVTSIDECTPVGFFRYRASPVYGDEGKDSRDWLTVWTTLKKSRLREGAFSRVFIAPNSEDLSIVREIYQTLLGGAVDNAGAREC